MALLDGSRSASNAATAKLKKRRQFNTSREEAQNWSQKTENCLLYLSWGGFTMPQMPKSRVVILGGGFGGLFTALELAGSHDVTLVTDSDHFVFTPMLYEYFSGEVEAWHIGPHYHELLDSNVNLVVATATTVDLDAQTVSLENRDPLSYDV